MENYEMHNKAKKEVKKVVSDSKSNTCTKSKDQKKKRVIFKLARIRKKRSRDLDHIICTKSNDQKVLVKVNNIKERSPSN